MTNDFIRQHLKTVYWVAHKYKSYQVPFEDLVQEGIIGLILAKDRYDENKGASFRTYSLYWIKDRIREYAKKNKTNLISIDDLIYYPELTKYLSDNTNIPEMYISEQYSDLVIKEKNKLDERVRAILDNKYYSLYPIPQNILCEEYSVSPQRILQLEQQGIKSLRKAVK